MSSKVTQHLLCATATTIVAGALAVPLAHADANCTVPGAHLALHHSSGYDVTVDASAATLGPDAGALTLGPGAVIRTPERSSDGNVTGGIKGRTIDFTIGWYGTRGYVHFTGTVGADGIAHGTSSGIADPINLMEGTWDSVGPLTC